MVLDQPVMSHACDQEYSIIVSPSLTGNRICSHLWLFTQMIFSLSRHVFNRFSEVKAISMNSSVMAAHLPADDKQKLLICGLPHSITDQVLELCRQAMVREHGACEVVNVNGMPPEMHGHIQSVAGPVLLWTDSPDRDAVEYARAAAFPILMLDADFGSVAREFMRLRNASLVDTLRVLALSRVGAWKLGEIPRAVTLPIAGKNWDAVQEMVAQALPAVAGLCGAGDVNVWAGVTGTDADAVSGDDENVDRVISSYSAFYGKENPQYADAFSIPISVLYDGIPPHNNVSCPIDVMGPARVITFGPFLYIPEGRWSLSFAFESTGNFAENSYMFDVFADMEVKIQKYFNIKNDGFYTYNCEFEISNPFQTFEFRTNLMKGSISGNFVPESLYIKRVGDQLLIQ